MPGNKTEARVPDLIEGKTYQFRVKAVNKAGPGKPSTASENLLAKDRFGELYYHKLATSCGFICIRFDPVGMPV